MFLVTLVVRRYRYVLAKVLHKHQKFLFLFVAMSVIQNIPEELLLDIFSNLSRQDLLKCQYICRVWYIPAHITLLTNVELRNITKTIRFITAINQNSSPRFLAAVKEMDIRPTKD